MYFSCISRSLSHTHMILSLSLSCDKENEEATITFTQALNQGHRITSPTSDERGGHSPPLMLDREDTTQTWGNLLVFWGIRFSELRIVLRESLILALVSMLEIHSIGTRLIKVVHISVNHSVIRRWKDLFSVLPQVWYILYIQTQYNTSVNNFKHFVVGGNGTQCSNYLT